MKNAILVFILMLAVPTDAEQSIEIHADGTVLCSDRGTLKLRVINDRIIQVIKSPTDRLPDRKSLSEVDHLKPDTEFRIAENSRHFILSTRQIQALVQKDNLQVSFRDEQGNLVLEETGSKIGPAVLPGDTAWTVSQTFSSPDDEAVYGLGSYQYDVMNWKNGFMRMQQKNTAIAMPVIVSNKGYGLFWHNYSLTTFNPDVDTLKLEGLDENRVGLEFIPKDSGPHTLILNKEDWFPVEMTLNDSLIYGHYGGVSYPWVIARVGLKAGVPVRIGLKKLDKPIYPTVSSRDLNPSGGKPGEKGLRAEYYSNMNFEGPPAFVRVDSLIDFNWENGGPEKGFPIDQFSVRWSGKLVAPATLQNVSLDVTTDDGVRVFLNGEKVIEDWRDRVPETDSVILDIEAGKTYDIVIEYYENGGGASARLSWSAGGAGQVSRLKGLMSLYCRPPEKSGTMTFQSEVADAIDYYFIYGPEPDTVVSGMRTITGKAPLYPKWAYGLHMCQYGWETQEKIESVIDGYRDRKIPVDVIVQDMNYWSLYPVNQWGSHRFDLSRYPDPASMIRHVHDRNARLIISVWPRINKGTDVYEHMSAHGYMLGVQDTRGRAGEGIVIADDSPNAAYDPFSADARKMYWDFMNERLFQLGIDGWWMDASEPEWGYDFSLAHTAMGSGRRFLNAYPLMAKKGVYEGQRSTGSSKRPYILTRSAFPGQQRYAAAVWTGDVSGDWAMYRRQIPAGLNYCITGAPYWTIDIGGFKDYITSGYDELLIRWFQYGTFLPIQRVHGIRKTEFYNHTQGTVDILTKYTHLRYRLMPYIYSLAASVTLEDFTLLRALVMDFREDTRVNDIPDQFMFGREIMVCPIVEKEAESRPVYLPETQGGWIDFWTGRRFKGGERLTAPAPLGIIPLYVKAGSIIPMGPVLQYATEKPADPIELRVFTGADGSFTLYEDENDNFNYEKGIHAVIPVEWNESGQTLTIGKRTGGFPGMLKKRTFRIVWAGEGHGAGLEIEQGADREVLYSGREVKIRKQVLPVPEPGS